MSEMEIDTRGNKYWRNPKRSLHREDGPAVEYADGAKAWYINGTLHREDGPAVEYATYGKKNWWYINGKQYLFEDWLDELQISDEEKILLCLKWK